jgi:pimeloyl-ACP methyl ester carboxylesterase
LTTLLAVELAVYVLGGAWLRSTGLSICTVALIALALAVTARLAFVAATFALTRAQPGELPPEAALSLGEKALLFMREWLAYTALFTFLQPLERLLRAQPQARTGSDAPPVLLVHGIYCNAAVWWRMRRRLQTWGLRNLYTVNLTPPLAHIDVFVAQLASEVERVCRSTAAPRVILVGHSMGGVVARAYAQQAAARVAKIITLGTPHHGSTLAHWGFGADARELRPGSAWLERLSAAEHAPPAVPIVSLYTWHDNYVAPRRSPVVAGATNVALRGVGHLTLLFSAAVARRVRDEIMG